MSVTAEAQDLEFTHFKRKIMALTGIDLNCYKGEQMRRRLNTLLFRTHSRNLPELAALIGRDPTQLKSFLDFFTINVSEFYRDRDKFEQLRTRVLPELLKERPRLSIWSAGCSYGAEPYTLAMLLDDLTPLGRHRLLATDIDKETLGRAKEGKSFTPADLRNVCDKWQRQYFVKSGENWEVVERIKRKVEFRQHNLLADPFEKDLDLILCRNVTIYFTESAKEVLNNRFAQSLRMGGVLFIGGTEIIPHAAERGLQHFLTSFYKKAGESAAVRVK